MARVPAFHSYDEYAAFYHADRSSDVRESVMQFVETYTKEYFPLSGTVSNSWAQLLHNPIVAKRMLTLSHFIVNDMPWAQRKDLREIAVLILNARYRCEYSQIAHFNAGLRAGLSAAQLSSVGFPESKIWTDEQRLVIHFTNAILDFSVTDELFERGRVLYGEKGVMELVVTVCYWLWWSIIINTLQPDLDFVPTEVPRVDFYNK